MVEEEEEETVALVVIVVIVVVVVVVVSFRAAFVTAAASLCEISLPCPLTAKHVVHAAATTRSKISL